MTVPQQRAIAEVAEFSPVPPMVAAAATRYQRFREIEQHHLERMARYNLLADWTTEIRAVVLDARERIREARAAREDFRRLVREFVLAQRSASEPLPVVLRHTRAMLQLLETSGALRSDGGWLEAEVLEWAIEEFETIS
jgi:predicted RNA-binding Zn ribbon-like protein